MYLCVCLSAPCRPFAAPLPSFCPSPQVQLWNVEHMCGALELDAKLKVVKSDPAVGQMLGLAASDLNRKLLSK